MISFSRWHFTNKSNLWGARIESTRYQMRAFLLIFTVSGVKRTTTLEWNKKQPNGAEKLGEMFSKRPLANIRAATHCGLTIFAQIVVASICWSIYSHKSQKFRIMVTYDHLECLVGVNLLGEWQHVSRLWRSDSSCSLSVWETDESFVSLTTWALTLTSIDEGTDRFCICVTATASVLVNDVSGL